MGRSRGRALISLAVVVLLLLAVAVASSGSVQGGSGGARRPSDRFLDTLVSLFLLWMVFGVLLWGTILMMRRDIVAESVADRRGSRSWKPILVLLLVGGTVLLIFDRLSLGQSLRERIPGTFGQGSAGLGRSDPATPGTYEPQFATGPVLVVIVLLAIATGAWYLSRRARRQRLEPREEVLLPALADVIEGTLDDLRAESNPRRAVIAAYARMEQALAAYGLPRGAAEAPDEYLQRILSDLEVSHRATSRLTALFAWAKFSSHDVAPEMKLEAIQALEAGHAELRAAEILAEERRIAAVTELRERAAH
ncbi:MAG: DUF4129 domain-containing protein [Thermoleophilia bacterium]|nr:DUF4129 domain-containing protein [Thermoleophilia bacterium]